MADVSLAFEAFQFSAGEHVLFRRVFERLQVDAAVQGDAIAPLLSSTSIPQHTLAKIWELADRSNKGHLTCVELFVLLRSVGLAQRGSLVTLESVALQKGDSSQPLPVLTGFAHPSQEEVEAFGREGAQFLPHSLLPDSLNPQFHVRVASPIKRDGIVQEHMVYTITVHCTMGILHSPSGIVRRRYSDFEWLRARLLENAMGLVVPPLPEKRFFGRFDEDFLESRRRGLEEFLNRLTADPVFLNSRPLLTFLEADDEAFANARARGAAVMDQLMSTLKVLSSVSLRSPKHVLPTDAKLEDFANLLASFKDHLKECKRLHATWLCQLDSEWQCVEALTLTVVPSLFPLSVPELNQMKEMSAKEVEITRRAHRQQFSDVVDMLIGQVRAVQEVIGQRESAHQLFTHAQHKLADKRLQLAAVKNNAQQHSKREQLERDINSLGKESDAAKHKFDTISHALDSEIANFNAMRERELLRAIHGVAESEALHAHSQTRWWEHLHQRLVFAMASEHSARVDVPSPLLAPAELLFALPSALPRAAMPAPDQLLFPPGTASNHTVPPPQDDDEDEEREGVVVGEREGLLGAVLVDYAQVPGKSKQS